METIQAIKKYKDESPWSVIKPDEQEKRSKVSLYYIIENDKNNNQVVTFYVPRFYKTNEIIFFTYAEQNKAIPAVGTEGNNDYVFCIGRIPLGTKIKDVVLCLN